MTVLNNVLNKDDFGLEEWEEREKKAARNRMRDINVRLGRGAPRGNWEEKVRRVARKSKTDNAFAVCQVPSSGLFPQN